MILNNIFRTKSKTSIVTIKIRIYYGTLAINLDKNDKIDVVKYTFRFCVMSNRCDNTFN